MMDIVLWAVQIILAIKFVSTAFTHGLGQNRGKMRTGIERMGGYARPWLFFAAIVLLLAGVGLVLPAVLGVPAWIVPLSAAIPAAMMLLSIFLHRRCREHPNHIPGLVLFAMALFVVVGRLVLSIPL
jgi:hypothetical protein